jgi:hypothetical protein
MGRDDMCVLLRMKILLYLRSEPVMTALAGVVPLHGGIAEECLLLPCPVGMVSPGENQDRAFRSAMAASPASFLSWKHHFWRHGLGEHMVSGLMLLW